MRRLRRKRLKPREFTPNGEQIAANIIIQLETINHNQILFDNKINKLHEMLLEIYDFEEDDEDIPEIPEFGSMIS